MIWITISLEAILNMLKPLSAKDKEWLADRLYEEISEREANDTVHDISQKVSRISRLRGIAKGITAQQIAEDDRSSYIVKK